MNDVLIEVNGVSLAYDQSEPVLHDISFSVKPGELYCLMGPNGCGKSTLINSIMGIHNPSAGNILVEGREISTYKPKDLARIIAYVPQSHQLTFPYTVEQVVLMGRNPYTRSMTGPGEEDSEIIARVLDETGISHLADRPYTMISGGEMQLVMLARALVQQTPVIVMDEPSAHLDFRNEMIFLENAAGLVRDSSTAVIIATHSPNHAFFFERKGISTEVLAICGKTLKFRGQPSEVLTEENIMEIYGVRSKILQGNDVEEGTVRQIVPLDVVRSSS